MKISEITHFLESKAIPFALLGSPETGRALVIEDGARVLALTAPGSERNVFWNHAGIAGCADRCELSRIGTGGMGGLRLWQAPEQAYMWKGTPDSSTFSNYQVQEDCDPGRYALQQTSPQRCVLEGAALLTDYRTGGRAGLEIRRILELAPLPEAYQTGGVDGVLLRQQNCLRLKEGDAGARADLWHLIQLPVPSRIGAFIKNGAEPVVYFNPANVGGWTSAGDLFTWPTNGSRMGKLGLSAASLTRGIFAILDFGTRTGVVLWNIPVSQAAAYVDSPPGDLRNDQAVQFWDGFGFCEVEYHSPGVSADSPEVHDTSELLYLEVDAERKLPLLASLGLPSNEAI